MSKYYKLFICLLFITACNSSLQTGKSLSSPLISATSTSLHIVATFVPSTQQPAKEQATTDQFRHPILPASGLLAFAYDPSGVYQIGVMNLVTGKITQVTNSPPPGDAEPFWSYDGQFLVFNSGRNGTGDLGIYRMKKDGSSQTLVATVHGYGGDYSPAVSPDGKYIIYHSNRQGKMAIYIASSDGSNEHALTDARANDITATWSPDGSRIIFSSDRGGNYALYTMKIDGSNVKPLFSVKDSELYRPRFSPDGKSILFGIQQFGALDYHLAIINSDGSNFREITHGSGQFSQGTWAGNGYIIFSGRYSNYAKWQLYIMKSDGSDIIQITPGDANYRNPSWVAH